MDTEETIDRLFLELSQFTKAKTAREIELERQLANALAAIGRYDPATTKERVRKVMEEDWELLECHGKQWREQILDDVMKAVELPPA